MARTGSVKHTHQYFRRADGCWACSGYEGDCTHYMPKNMYPLPVGRKSVCWGTGKSRHEFMLTYTNMKRTQPMCPECLAGLDAASELMKKHKLDDFKPNPLTTVQRMKEIQELLKSEAEELGEEIEIINPEEKGE